MNISRVGQMVVLALSWSAGCSKEGDDVTTIVNPLFRGELTFTADGGNAAGDPASTRGGSASYLIVRARGNIFVGINPPPLAPAVPAAPATGTEVTSWTDTLTILHGNAIVNGAITAGSTEVAATLNVPAGDLVINGSLTSANNGGSETNLEINVSAGTVWIHGTIRTGNVDATADGDHAGDIRITALRIIFTGAIQARGEDNPAGSGGGNVWFITEGAATGQTSQLLVGGDMDLAGGAAAGAVVSGGNIVFYTSGGVASIGTYGGNIAIRGTILARGGSGLGIANSHGGSGGRLEVHSDVWVGLLGPDGRGGDITLDAGALIDLCGGAGGSGGDGLNNGAPGVTGPVAVLLDADGTNSNNVTENGIIRNFGTIEAHRESTNGSGGDVLFDGLDASGVVGPAPGIQDLSGYGTGLVGDFLSQ